MKEESLKNEELIVMLKLKEEELNNLKLTVQDLFLEFNSFQVEIPHQIWGLCDKIEELIK